MPRKPLCAPTRKPIRLKPVRANVGIQIAYQKKLDAMIDRMHRSIDRTIAAAWRRKPPVMAQDDSPAVTLGAAIRNAGREWLDRFDTFARESGRRFAEQATGHADRSFAAALRDAGFTVQFKMTAAARDVMQATIAEQVGLIKSIPSEYLTQVQGSVMRSVQAGRDLGTLSAELQQQFGVTKRRAATISRDQNAKATASMNRVRQLELGITTATWYHSSAGRKPRPTHVAMNGKVYDVAKGMFDPAEGKFVLPGELINCRCFSRSIVPGLE